MVVSLRSQLSSQEGLHWRRRETGGQQHTENDGVIWCIWVVCIVAHSFPEIVAVLTTILPMRCYYLQCEIQVMLVLQNDGVIEEKRWRRKIRYRTDRIVEHRLIGKPQGAFTDLVRSYTA